jgi:hypothetical protein
MVPGQQVLELARRGKLPPNARVYRARKRQFLLYSIFVLLTYYGYTAIRGIFDPIPMFTWDAPTSSSVVLAVIVLEIIIWQYIRSRARVLIMLSDGFVIGNMRSGHVRLSVSYQNIASVSMRLNESILPQLVVHLTMKDGQEIAWPVEEYFTLSAAEIARQVFCAFVYRRMPSRRSQYSSSNPPLSPEQVMQVVADGQEPLDWHIFRAWLGFDFLQHFAPWFVGATAFVGIVVNAYFIKGPSLQARFSMERSFGDVLGTELVALGTVIFLSWFFIQTGIPLFRRLLQSNIQLIITPWACIVATKQSYRIKQVIEFRSLATTHITRSFRSFVWSYQTKAGVEGDVYLYNDQYKKALSIALWLMENTALNSGE